jgi:glucose/arabinose dehydrogenase
MSISPTLFLLLLGVMPLVQRSHATFTTPAPARALALRPHAIRLRDGKRFTLNIPEGYDITVAADGLRRVRFMAKSPDNRIFVTDMYDRTDNRKGKVYILEGFDPARGRFAGVRTYLSDLRNPNSVAFRTDGDGTQWLYLALTDRLVRYRYRAGDTAPTGALQELATFPAYGLSYKYGGWHLTRTIAPGGNGKIYVAVGSSCNACEEKEDVRASVLEMNPDGSNQRIYARGLRNSVGLRWIGDRLVATAMGADHLGDNRPEDAMYVLRDGANYGWPYCYQYRSRIYSDTAFRRSPKRVDPKDVPLAYATFKAHSAPLGLEYFGADADPALADCYLVALHGSSKIALKHGYSVVRVREGAANGDFITGFLSGGHINGRPCDIMSAGGDAFFVTDDYAGAVYYVFRKK